MLKLLKYDLRRRRERILVFIVIALLIQAGMWISSSAMNVELVSLNLAVYAVLAISLIFIAVFSYFRNLKSYQRRLLPVTPMQSLLSPILLAVLLTLVVIVIGLLHLGIYRLMYPMDFLPDNILSVGIRSLLQAIWSSTFLMIIVMFSITVALSLRFKWRVWVGIALLTLMQNAVSYLENVLFDSYFVGLDNTFNFVLYEDSHRPGSGFTIRYLATNQWPWPLVFEFAIVCILIYSMVMLIKKRIEV